MKQFILSYKDFLNSQKLDETVLTQREHEKYASIQVVEDVKEIHKRIFGEQERIYIPFDFSYFKNYEKSKTQIRVEYILSKNGYEIISYSENKCKKENDSRLTSIAKVLQSKNVNKPDLAIDYGEDVEKTRTLEPTTDMFVCISCNSDDIASMSTDRSWTSCQDIRRNTGYNQFVAEDLKEGSIIAYLIKSTDKEIEDPEARILIKPFINTKDSKDIVLLPSTVSYYRGKNKKFYTPLEKYPNFYKFLMSWAKSVQPNMDGTYRMNYNVYQDGDTTARVKRDLTAEEIERVEEPQTKEDLKLAFRYYGLSLRNVIFDEDGFVEYEDDIVLEGNFRTLPKMFSFIHTISGNLNLTGCPRLKSFKNLENLRSVKNILTVQERNNIKDTKALENLENVELIRPRNLLLSYLEMKNPKFKETLENPKTKEDYLNILRFYDIENVNKDELWIEDGVVSYDNLKFTRKSKEDIKNVLKHFTEVEHLSFYSCSDLKDFTGLENLKKIDKLTCVECPLESFKGLDNCEILEFDTPYKKVLKDFIQNNEKLNERIYNNPQTHEDLRLLFKLESYFENIRDLKIDDNGLWSTSETIYLKSKDFTEFPKIFKRLESCFSINIYDCALKDFTGLDNLKTISQLIIEKCDNLESFKGLENVKILADVSVKKCPNIKILDGLPKDLDIKYIATLEFRKKYIGYTNPKLQETLDNPKTIEDFKTIKDFYGYSNDILDVSEVEINEDGLWIYNGDIHFSKDKTFTEFPKCFKYLKEIKGNLYCYRTSLESFEGLENLQTIGWELNCYDTSITSFEGLENLQKIGKDLNCNQTPLESFKGLENLQKIGKSLICYKTKLESFKGLENLQSIGGSLYCSETSIKDFTGLSKDIKINGYIEPKELYNQYKNS